MCTLLAVLRLTNIQGGRQWDKTGSKTVEQGRQWERLVRQRDSRAGRRTSQGGDSGTRQAAEWGMQRNRARL